jgi:predicted alpha/beta superfamily hydrolase
MRPLIPMLFLLVAPLSAQDSSITLWTRQVIQSSKLNEQRSIYVATPQRYAETDQRYPVLVVLDAEDRLQFNLALANVAFWSNRGAIPRLIVVGIPNAKDRAHDLTPRAVGTTAKDFPTAGGAGNFLDFIIDEVLPLVRSKYRTLPSTVLAGHSFGGLLALEAASKKPGTFVGIIAASPALWWNDSTGIVPYSDAIARAPQPQRLFLTSGSLDDDIDRHTQTLARRLDSLKPQSLAFGHTRYIATTHNMTPAPTLVDGLRFIFEPVSVSSLPVEALSLSADSAEIAVAIAESKKRYANGARMFGLDQRLPEPELNTLGYLLIQFWKKPRWAVWAFRQNVDIYPDSPNAYDSLGDALLAAGDTVAAMTEFRHGIDASVRTKRPVMERTRAKLKRLEESRGKAK